VWKGRYRCAATLSVDFDAESLWSGTFKLMTPSPLSRGDYDIRAGLPRILDLLDRHELPATFMVPGQVAEEHRDACRAIARRGVHEVGYHGYYHESVLDIPIEEERELMRRGIAKLEEIFAQTPAATARRPSRSGRTPPISSRSSASSTTRACSVTTSRTDRGCRSRAVACATSSSCR